MLHEMSAHSNTVRITTPLLVGSAMWHLNSPFVQSLIKLYSNSSLVLQLRETVITIIKARASFSGHVNTTGFLCCWFKVKLYLIMPKLPFKSLGHAQCCARLNSLSEQCNITGKHYSVMFTQGGK